MCERRPNDGCLIQARGTMKTEPQKTEAIKSLKHQFAKIATTFAHWAGRPSAFILALLVVIVWCVTGPIFNFSDTWQLVINTGTTIVTFLMVFLIQNEQDRDTAAIQVKLDELIRSSRAENVFVGIEHLTGEEIEELRTKCEARAKQRVHPSRPQR